MTVRTAASQLLTWSTTRRQFCIATANEQSADRGSGLLRLSAARVGFGASGLSLCDRDVKGGGVTLG